MIVLALGVIGLLIQFRKTHALLPLEGQFEASLPLPLADSPLFLSDEGALPAFSSNEVWIYDRESGSLLFEKNAEVATSVASLAKLMTAFVSYETYNLTDTVPIGTASQVEGNRAKFLPTDVFTVRDLLQALLMFSANDAAQALAQGEKAGSIEQFVARMNQRAEELDLHSTHFQNVTGLDEPGQYSSARDIGILVDAFLHTPFFSQTVRQQAATIQETRTGRQDTVYTTNTMLYKGAEFTGVKTGTTAQAGESLVVRLQDTWSIPVATSGGELVDTPVDLVFVFLGSQDRYLDATNITEWLKRTVRWREEVQQTSNMQEI